MFLTPKMPRDRQQRNLTWWSLWSDLEIIVAALMSVKYLKARQCYKKLQTKIRDSSEDPKPFFKMKLRHMFLGDFCLHH